MTREEDDDMEALRVGPPEWGQMSKPRTILVPRLRMQRPAMVSEDLASLLAALEQGLHEVGPRLQSVLGMLEWQTGQKRSTLFIIVVTLLCVYMVTSKNAPLVCSLVVYLIAAYASFHNIENSSKSDDSRWIIFWLIFGLFNVMDYFTDQIRANFPLFWLFKLLFLTWCLAPTGTNGVTIIYIHLLYPLFLGVNDHCVMDFESSRSLCNRIWHQCYPWACEPEPRAKKMEDSGEPARPAALEELPHASEKASVTENPSADKKPAGDAKGKASSSTLKGDGINLKKVASRVDDAAANTFKGTAEKVEKPELVGEKLPDFAGKDVSSTAVQSAKGEARFSAQKASASKHTKVGQPPPNPCKPPSQAPTKSASDTVVKSKTGSQDLNEETYQSHLSSNRTSRNERGAGASSWNDVSLFSKKGDDDSGGSLLASSKSSIPVIQPVVQPLFSLYPYSSACGSTNTFAGQPPVGSYAFGPSYPSYHAGPFYPGCLQRPSLGCNRPRMLLYSGQRQKQLGSKNTPSLEESENDVFVDDSKPLRKAKGLSRSSSDKVRDDFVDGRQVMQHRVVGAGANREEGKKTADEADRKATH